VLSRACGMVCYTGMDLLRQEVPADAQSILDYFDKTYVSGSVRQLINSNVVRRIEPLYPPHVWNVQLHHRV